MNTSLINSINCVLLATGLDCISNGCEWVMHATHPSVCTYNYRLSPFEIKEVIAPGMVCPPLPPEPIHTEVVVDGVSDWVIVVVAFGMLFLGTIGTLLFFRVRLRLRERRAHALQRELVALAQPPLHFNWQNYEERQVEQRIRGVAQLAGLADNNHNVRQAIVRVDEELGWRPQPVGPPNREEGNILLQARYFGEDDVVVLADDPLPNPQRAQVRRRLSEPHVLLRDGLNSPKRTRIEARY